jgi:hypothetical protein
MIGRDKKGRFIKGFQNIDGGKIFEEERVRKIKASLIGNKRGVGNKNHLGYKHSQETKKRISLAKKGKPIYKNRGAKCHLWKGGKTKESIRVRMSLEYKNWREAVFSRDNWTCQECGCRSKRGVGKAIVLNAHHINSFAEHRELRFDINNGITLCVECHKKTKTYAGKNRKK